MVFESKHELPFGDWIFWEVAAGSGSFRAVYRARWELELSSETPGNNGKCLRIGCLAENRRVLVRVC